jgi:gliding motility-associated-like protein
MKKIVILITLWTLTPFFSKGQLLIDNTVNAIDGVQTILLGGGVTITNLTSVGDNAQFGSFNCVSCNLGITSGLVMASGNVEAAAGPNTMGSTNMGPTSGPVSDADLEELSGNTMESVAIIEFDFIPTGDSVAFNFVFGSEEYPEFVGNPTFNDAFGFFLSGPGVSGPFSNNARNIALVPNTTSPIAISNVNNGTTGTNGPCVNCAYYVNNQSSAASTNFQIEPDGFTTVLTARSLVQCGEVYHIKLAIGDSFDDLYDSYVFLEAGSFQSNQLAAAIVPAAIAPSDNALFEGCSPGQITFTRPSLSAPTSYALSITGSAINGVDYESLSTNLVFAPNSLEATVNIEAIQDNTAESTETIIISIVDNTPCGLAATEYVLEIWDIPTLNVTPPDLVIECDAEAVLTPVVSGGVGFYHIEWENGVESLSLTITDPVEGSIAYTVSDTCGVTSVESLASISFVNHPPLTVNVGPDLQLTCLDAVEIAPAVSGGYGSYSYEWTSGGIPLGNDAQLYYEANAAGTISLFVTDVCGEENSDQLTFSFPPVPVQVDLGNDLSVTCIEVTQLVPTVTGGVGSYSYNWSDQNGQLGNGSTLNYSTENAATVALIVEDECGNVQEDFVSFAVPQVAVFTELGPDLTVTCLDETELIPSSFGGVGNYTYTWYLNNQVAHLGNTFTVQGDEDMNISVLIEDQCGNVSEDEVSVFVPPAPINVDAGPDLTSTCLDGNEIAATVTGGVGAYSYVWTRNDGTVLSIASNFGVEVGNTTDLTVTVSDQCGNEGVDNVRILIPPVPVYLSLPADTAICLGESVAFQAQAFGGVGELSVEWNNSWPFGDFQDAPAESRTYFATAVDECGNTTTEEVFVTVEDVDAGFTSEYTGPFTVELFDASKNAVHYEWFVNDAFISEEKNIRVVMSDILPVDIKLEVTGSLGCKKTIEQVFIPEGDLYIPNAFTPDNDGVNDFFQVKGHDIRDFEIWIFNRWGELVYHSTDMNQVWDASHLGGDHYVKTESYTYRLMAVGARNTVIKKHGSITIIR